MSSNIDQLKLKKEKLNEELEELKNKISSGFGSEISVEEIEKQKDKITEKINDLKEKIQIEINKLKNKADEESKKILESAKALYEELEDMLSSSVREISELYSSIVDTLPTSVGSTSAALMSTDTTPIPKFETGNSITIIPKKKKDWRMFAAGSASILGLGLLGGLAVKGRQYIKGKYNKWKLDREKKKQEEEERKEKERKETEQKKKKNSWRKRGLAILGIGTAGFLGYKYRDKVKDFGGSMRNKLFKKDDRTLDFDTALNYSKGAISNEGDMGYDLNVEYEETITEDNKKVSEIVAYGKRVKIDKDKKIIIGLDNIKFEKYEHMICAAILIAYLKNELSGRCKTANPFYLTRDLESNLNVNTGDGKKKAVDGTGNGGVITGVTIAGIAGIVSGIFGGGPQTGFAVAGTAGIIGAIGGYEFDSNNILHRLIPEIDCKYGMENLGAYLNNLGGRQERNQTDDEITESPIKDEVVKVKNKIQDKNPRLPARGGYRQIDAIPDEYDESKYQIKAYGRAFEAEVTGTEGNREIRILGLGTLDSGDPPIKLDMSKGDFKNLKLPLEEGLYMITLIGFLLENFKHKGKDDPWFYYTDINLIRNTTFAKEFKKHFGNKSTKDDVGGICFNDKTNWLGGDTSSSESSDTSSSESISDKIIDSIPFMSKEKKEELKQKVPDVSVDFDTLAVTSSAFYKRMPTLFKKENRDRFLKFLNNGITDMNNIPIRKK